MANNFEADEAINAYKQALEIKPNLVRTWANLGIAHSNNVSGPSCCSYRLVASLQAKYREAINFYLSALTLNPNADHIWEYLHTSCVCMNRFDLVTLARNKDPELFRKEFNFLRKNQLPKPTFDNLYEHKLMQEEFEAAFNNS